MKNSLKIFFVLIIFYSHFSAYGQNVEFKTEKEKFKEGEKVCFSLKNVSEEIIYLPSSAPWAILREEKVDKRYLLPSERKQNIKDKKIVYSPIAAQVIVKLKKGQSKKWCWKQKNIDGKQVKPGKYEVRITVFNKNGKKIILSKEFEIDANYKKSSK